MAMRINFRRNSNATQRAASGVFTVQGIDVLRREFDESTGEPIGVLIEQQSTNLWNLNRKFGPGNEHVFERFVADPFGNELAAYLSSPENQFGRINPVISSNVVGGSFSVFVSDDSAPLYMLLNYRDTNSGSNYKKELVNPADRSITRNTFQAAVQPASEFARYAIYTSEKNVGGYVSIQEWHDAVTLYGAQLETTPIPTSYIPTDGSAATRAADLLDAPAGDWLPSGRHTWRGSVRMSADPRQPTILGHPGGRIYASGGRLLLDGPGTLWQPDGEHAAGAIVPLYWTVELPGTAPDFALGRAAGDTDWWNSHLIDIVPYPRVISESEIRRELGL